MTLWLLPNNRFRLTGCVTLALILGLLGAGCGRPSSESTRAMASPAPTSSPVPTAMKTLPPASTATSTTQTSPVAVPSPTATTERSPLTVPAKPVASADELAFDGDSAYDFVLQQCALGLRPTGSEAGWATGDYLISQLGRTGWQVVIHEFTFHDVKGRNIIGKRGTGPVAMLGAHYDTRPYADHNPEGQRDQGILGANDGGSGVAVLLELARTLDVEKTGHEIWLAFFDAEDRGRLDNWPFSVGASLLARDIAASNLPELAQRPKFLIVVDMVGDADQQLYYEGFSNPKLSERIWTLAGDLGYGSVFVPTVKHHLMDDHRPFIEIGVAAIDIIDFDYPYWHTTEDTTDKVAPASLERVGKVLELFLELGGTW